MAQPGLQRLEIRELRRRAAEERERARRAAELALEYEARIVNCAERLRAVYVRGAELHRRMEERQLAAARLHEAYAERLEQQTGRPWPAPPPFMAAVAQTLGVSGAAAALYSRDSPVPVLVATSDPIAEQAYDLEVETGEGPVLTTVSKGIPVCVAGGELPAHWPWYGPAAIRLGIHLVTAVPLQLPTIRLGALCCYDVRPRAKADVAAVRVVAGAPAPILLRTASSRSLRDLTEAPRSVPDD